MTTFSVQKRERANQKTPRKDVSDKVFLFAKNLNKEFGDFLKAVVLYGSCTTHPGALHGDIDVLVVIDDVGRVITPEVIEAYRLIVHKHATKISPLLHINTLKLSTFWDYARQGDPVVVNMFRDGVVMLDKGIFAPMQILLDQGRIRPTKEAIFTYYGRAGSSLRAAQQHILSACTDLYWAAMNAAHSALMSVGEMPTSPERIADLLDSMLVKRKILDARYVHIMREIYNLQKAIDHREIVEVTGDQYKVYWNETTELVEALKTIVETKNS